MAITRVTAIFEHENGLPRDAVTNTFHFTTDGSALEAASVAAMVTDFFASLSAGMAHTIMSYMATTHDTVLAKAYTVNDVIDDDGVLRSNSGEPIFVSDPISVAIKQSQENMPSEVALCLSYRNTTDVATPRARRTGRLYLGPFNRSVWPGAVNTIPRPDPAANTDFRLAAQDLQDTAAANGTPWVVYSRPFGGRAEIPRPGRSSLRALAARAAATHLVDQCWTDDAFDTQRRRGERATAKVTLAL